MLHFSATISLHSKNDLLKDNWSTFYKKKLLFSTSKFLI